MSTVCVQIHHTYIYVYINIIVCLSDIVFFIAYYIEWMTVLGECLWTMFYKYKKKMFE